MFFFDKEAPKEEGGIPPIGTTLYLAREHLYYVPGRAGPLLEYVVFAGKVAQHLPGPRKLMCLRGTAPEGYTELVYVSANSVGTNTFRTERDAAQQARTMTDDYEKRWAFTERWGDIPLRRPWEELLKEAL